MLFSLINWFFQFKFKIKVTVVASLNHESQWFVIGRNQSCSFSPTLQITIWIPIFKKSSFWIIQDFEASVFGSPKYFNLNSLTNILKLTKTFSNRTKDDFQNHKRIRLPRLVREDKFLSDYKGAYLDLSEHVSGAYRVYELGELAHVEGPHAVHHLKKMLTLSLICVLSFNNIP